MGYCEMGSVFSVLKSQLFYCSVYSIQWQFINNGPWLLWESEWLSEVM